MNQKDQKQAAYKTRKTAILIHQSFVDQSSSPIFEKKYSNQISSDGHSISLSECISMKHLAQHKINGFLQELVKKPYPKNSSNSVSIGTDQSCSSGSYYYPNSVQLNSFQTPRSFAAESRSVNNLKSLTPRRNIQQQQVQSIAEGLNRLSLKIGIIDKKFNQYDIYKEQSIGLEAVILFMRSYIFPEMTDYTLYQMVQSFIYDRKNRQFQSRASSSYSPKFTSLKKDQIVRLVVDNINEQQQQQSKSYVEMPFQQTYESQPRSYFQEQDQMSNRQRPLTMCDIQGGTMAQNIQSPNQQNTYPPQSQTEVNQEGSSSIATFKIPLGLNCNNNNNNNNNNSKQQTISRRSLFKINRTNIQQNLKKFTKRGIQTLGNNKFLMKLETNLPNTDSQFVGTNQTFSNQNYCHNKQSNQESKIDLDDQNNSSAILEQRVLQMQNHISEVKQQTTKLKQQLQQKLTPKVERQGQQSDGIMIPKDLLTSLISTANQKSSKKPGSQKKKKKSRGSSLSNKNHSIPKSTSLKNSASQAGLPSGHLLATPIEPVYMTKKGGGALIMKRRNESFSPSSAYNNIHHTNKNTDKFYVLQKSPDKAFRSPFRQSLGRRIYYRDEILNQSAVDDISYQHNLNRPCKSRYCLVCRGKYY